MTPDERDEFRAEIARAAVAEFARREPLLWRAGETIRPRHAFLPDLTLLDRMSAAFGWWTGSGGMLFDDTAREEFRNHDAAERAAKQYDKMMKEDAAR